MPSLLTVLASPRGDQSISSALTKSYVEEWQKTHSGGTVVTRELNKTELPFVDVPWITGAYSPEDSHSPEVKKALAIGNTLIAELQAADHILIATPMYNFTVPAVLKAYIDHICRVNVTFTPQYEGLLKGKKVTVIVASGGLYTEASGMSGYNSETPYLKAVLGFIGLTDINFVMAGGSSAVAKGETTMEALVAQYVPDVIAAVK